MFYMAVRYEGGVSGELDLELTDDMITVTSSGTRMGRLTTLIEWSLLDPVDDREAPAMMASMATSRTGTPSWTGRSGSRRSLAIASTFSLHQSPVG
jgi:hypothetical protein